MSRHYEPYYSKLWGHRVHVLKPWKPCWYNKEGRKPADKVISLDEYRRRAQNLVAMDEWIKARKER